MQESRCNRFEGFLLLSSNSEYNAGCPPDNLVTEKIQWQKTEWVLPHFTLQTSTDPAAKLANPDYLCVGPASALQALRCLFCLLRQPSRLFRQFWLSAWGQLLLLRWPFWLYVKPAWAQIGPTSVLLVVALPPLVSLCLFVSTPELSVPLCCRMVTQFEFSAS